MLNVPISDDFVSLCSDWAGGTDCMLRAISSTKGLTRGSIRPWNHDEERPMTDNEWTLSLWESLGSDLRSILRLIRPGHEDYVRLSEFKAFVVATIDRLEEYNHIR